MALLAHQTSPLPLTQSQRLPVCVCVWKLGAHLEKELVRWEFGEHCSWQAQLEGQTSSVARSISVECALLQLDSAAREAFASNLLQTEAEIPPHKRRDRTIGSQAAVASVCLYASRAA